MGVCLCGLIMILVEDSGRIIARIWDLLTSGFNTFMASVCSARPACHQDTAGCHLVDLATN